MHILVTGRKRVKIFMILLYWLIYFIFPWSPARTNYQPPPRGCDAQVENRSSNFLICYCRSIPGTMPTVFPCRNFWLLISFLCHSILLIHGLSFNNAGRSMSTIMNTVIIIIIISLTSYFWYVMKMACSRVEIRFQEGTGVKGVTWPKVLLFIVELCSQRFQS